MQPGERLLPAPAAAETAILAAVAPLPTEPAPLAGVAGRILRQDVVADRDQPPFNRVTMDGIAIDSAAAATRRRFAIAGSQPAGAPQQALPSSDCCFEVMTGAVLPAGCDCVVPLEQIDVIDGHAHLRDGATVGPWQYVHMRGLDCRAGDRLLEAGVRIEAPEVAVMAASGLARVTVARPPSIMVISTGDELVEPGEPVADWQIRSSNGYTLSAALAQHGFTRLGHDQLPDDQDILKERLRAHLDTHDVLVLSGGVSMGRYDLVPEVLAQLGVELVLHRVAQRPGKPMWFGVRHPDKSVFALPGNPVSALVCTIRYVIPGLRAAMGARTVPPEPIALAEPFELKPRLSFFLPVKRVVDADGRIGARPCPTRGSGDFTSLIGTDGFVELPPGPQTVPAGFVAPFYGWRAA
jgi:molybdopterin molybdotransferase